MIDKLLYSVVGHRGDRIALLELLTSLESLGCKAQATYVNLLEGFFPLDECLSLMAGRLRQRYSTTEQLKTDDMPALLTWAKSVMSATDCRRDATTTCVLTCNPLYGPVPQRTAAIGYL